MDNDENEFCRNNEFEDFPTTVINCKDNPGNIKECCSCRLMDNRFLLEDDDDFNVCRYSGINFCEDKCECKEK